jgi:hypothetical protein
MRVTKLIIKNIGLIEHEEIAISKPLLLFYGEIRQGKSTILNAVRWVCGGSWPSDIIRHGAKEGSIELEFSGGSISRSWYRAQKTGETKAREIAFIRDGKPVPRPAQAIQSLLNPFLSNQNHLADMGEADRKKFFTELFAVDTTALDTELYNAGRRASELRATLSAYRDIDLTEHKTVDAQTLKTKLNSIRTEYDEACESKRKTNQAIVDANAEIARREEVLDGEKKEIARLEEKLAAVRANVQQIETWLKTHPKGTQETLPAKPDTAALEAQIQDAAAQNVRAEQYVRNKSLAEKRDGQRKELDALETRQREIRAEKTAKLASVTDESGIKGLKFDEDGNFSYNGTTASMLSTSEIMQLSNELSSLYPEGLGISLIDRGESLGKSIFEYVDRAKEQDLTILATIVGERPATVPADVGVFVVEKGKLTDGNLL